MIIHNYHSYGSVHLSFMAVMALSLNFHYNKNKNLKYQSYHIRSKFYHLPTKDSQQSKKKFLLSQASISNNVSLPYIKHVVFIAIVINCDNIIILILDDILVSNTIKDYGMHIKHWSALSVH